MTRSFSKANLRNWISISCYKRSIHLHTVNNLNNFIIFLKWKKAWNKKITKSLKYSVIEASASKRWERSGGGSLQRRSLSFPIEPSLAINMHIDDLLAMYKSTKYFNQTSRNLECIESQLRKDLMDWTS